MENLAWLVLDTTFAIALLALAWGALASRDPRRAVALFIGFGLLLALIWIRLRAPDIALAEAAIGAGLTGALLLSALRDTPGVPSSAAESPSAFARPLAAGALLVLLSSGLALVLGAAFVHALDRTESARLADEVFANMGASGVSNPVTGILLNFRAYDTLLELAVLMAAALGILSLGPARSAYLSSGPVLTSLTSWLVPLLVVVSGYLLWGGAQAPGGAFQAGALLAAAGVLLRLAGHPAGGLPRELAVRGLMIGGVAMFVLVGLGLMVAGRGFLDYPVSWAGGLILLIESAATLSIATTLILAFLCGMPVRCSADRDTRPSDPVAAGCQKDARIVG